MNRHIMTLLGNYPTFDHETLIRRYGSPLFVVFPDVFRANIRRFKEALDRYYPASILAYSVKTNYLPFVVCKIIESGVIPEIISGVELEMLEKLAKLNNETIVNGPLKTEAELRKIIKYRCRINVDNFTELEVLEKLGRETGTCIEVGLRVSAELGEADWLRFGFRCENGEVEEVARRVHREMTHVRVIGLHFHGGTNITDVNYYANASVLLADLSTRLSGLGLMVLKYLDIGGGFATNCSFKDKTRWIVPTAEEYVAAISAPIIKAFGANAPTLILEPGRYIIDDAFVLLTTVERIRGIHRDAAILDAGINVFPSARFRRHKFINLTSLCQTERRYTLFGPLCMQSDCMSDGVTLPELTQGDVLCVDYAGAYSITQSWNFIRLQPAVVALEDGDSVLVREKETIDHFLSRDVIH